ncbi:MAG: hypothetical protein KIT45_13595 [Fimbriimonadia bacterium]|nr:hypothetical protein [Fimbriimonadia bacterium]
MKTLLRAFVLWLAIANIPVIPSVQRQAVSGDATHVCQCLDCAGGDQCCCASEDQNANQARWTRCDRADQKNLVLTKRFQAILLQTSFRPIEDLRRLLRLPVAFAPIKRALVPDAPPPRLL